MWVDIAHMSRSQGQYVFVCVFGTGVRAGSIACFVFTASWELERELL